MGSMTNTVAAQTATGGADTDVPVASGSATHKKGHREGVAALTLGALGVVYGDIGTSPLYAIKEIFNPEHELALDRKSVV